MITLESSVFAQVTADEEGSILGWRVQQVPHCLRRFRTEGAVGSPLSCTGCCSHKGRVALLRSPAAPGSSWEALYLHGEVSYRI